MSSVFNALIQPGISKQTGIEYEAIPNICDQIYKREKTRSRVVDTQGWEMYGRPGRRMPGEEFAAGEFRQSFGHRIVIKNWGMYDALPNEDIEDDPTRLITQILPATGGGIARAFRTNEELVCAEYMMNLAYTSATGLQSQFDGVALASLSHPVSQLNAGVIKANTPTSQVDLSIAAFDGMVVNMMLQKAANNQEILNGGPTHLVTNQTIRRVAMQILDGKWERDTANRNLNIYKGQCKLLEWGYFQKSGATGTNNAWFAFGKNHKLVKIHRMNFQMDTDKDITTNSQIWVAMQRFEVGHRDWRDTYFSQGG